MSPPSASAFVRLAISPSKLAISAFQTIPPDVAGVRLVEHCERAIDRTLDDVGPEDILREHVKDRAVRRIRGDFEAVGRTPYARGGATSSNGKAAGVPARASVSGPRAHRHRRRIVRDDPPLGNVQVDPFLGRPVPRPVSAPGVPPAGLVPFGGTSIQGAEQHRMHRGCRPTRRAAALRVRTARALAVQRRRDPLDAVAVRAVRLTTEASASLTRRAT